MVRAHMGKRKKQKKVRGKGGNKGRGPRSAVYTMGDHVGKIPRMAVSDNQIYEVVQTLPDSVLSQGGSDAFFVGAWNGANLNQFTGFANLFDQFRIAEVQVIFRPFYRDMPMQANTFIVPLLYVVVDYDDTATPTIAMLQSFQNCNISEYETVSVCFTPHVAVAGSYGGTFSQYQNEPAPWYDTATPNATHYGIKSGCQAVGSGQTVVQAWHISVRLRVQFKNVR